jgi:hypothetical protein
MNPGFRYTDEQWAAISRELARIGFNADTSIDGVKDVRDIRGALEFAAFSTNYSGEENVAEEDEKRVAKYARLLSQALEKMDLGNKQNKDFANLAAALKVFKTGVEGTTISLNLAFRVTHERNPAYILIDEALRVYAAACAHSSPDKFPRYAIGEPDGPTISFLYEAVKPALGKKTPTKEAIRQWMIRSQNRPHIKAKRDGKPDHSYDTYESLFAIRDEWMRQYIK